MVTGKTSKLWMITTNKELERRAGRVRRSGDVNGTKSSVTIKDGRYVPRLSLTVKSRL